MLAACQRQHQIFGGNSFVVDKKGTCQWEAVRSTPYIPVLKLWRILCTPKPYQEQVCNRVTEVNKSSLNSLAKALLLLKSNTVDLGWWTDHRADCPRSSIKLSGYSDAVNVLSVMVEKACLQTWEFSKVTMGIFTKPLFHMHTPIPLRAISSREGCNKVYKKNFCKPLASYQSCWEAISTAVSIHTWGLTERTTSSKFNSMETGWCLQAQYAIEVALSCMCCFI